MNVQIKAREDGSWLFLSWHGDEKRTSRVQPRPDSGLPGPGGLWHDACRIERVRKHWWRLECGFTNLASGVLSQCNSTARHRPRTLTDSAPEERIWWVHDRDVEILEVGIELKRTPVGGIPGFQFMDSMLSW